MTPFTKELITFKMFPRLKSICLLEVVPISYGSKYFGWLAALAIIVLGGWFTLPAAYETLIMVFSPQFGNYMRPTAVMLNLLIINPLNNPIAFALWIVAGLVGGIVAGTKKGGFVVGLVTWLSCLGVIAFCVLQIFQAGISFGTFIIPPGYSFADFLGIPIVQTLIDTFLGALTGMSSTGFGPDMIMQLIMPLIIYFLIPVITVIIAAIVGAAIRPKE